MRISICKKHEGIGGCRWQCFDQLQNSSVEHFFQCVVMTLLFTVCDRLQTMQFIFFSQLTHAHMVDQFSDPGLQCAFKSIKLNFLKDSEKTNVENFFSPVIILCVIPAHVVHACEISSVQDFLRLAIIVDAS